MSSRGMTRAQMEARRRELERQREEQRRKQVKQQVMEAATAIERELLNLASEGQAAWVHEEVAAITEVVESVKSAPAEGKKCFIYTSMCMVVAVSSKKYKEIENARF